MKITAKHKKEKCPKCGSKEILTLGLDQMCGDCDWDNSLMLVNLGQLDSPARAIRQQFDPNITFESLAEIEETTDRHDFNSNQSLIA